MIKLPKHLYLFDKIGFDLTIKEFELFIYLDGHKLPRLLMFGSSDLGISPCPKQ
jgi:hypothetical protein